MKFAPNEIPPKIKTEDNEHIDPIPGSSIYDNLSIERKKETSAEFDKFILSVKDLDYWKLIKDSRFEQYGGHEIENYQNHVGLLGIERKEQIIEFLSDNNSIYQQGKFLRLLRNKLNRLNLDIALEKSGIKINKNYGENVKKEEKENIRRQEVFHEYETIINDLLNSKRLNYIVNDGLLKAKEWMNSSHLKRNEEYAMPFKQIGKDNILLDGTQFFILKEEKEEISKLKQEYNEAEKVLRTTDNYILENSGNHFHQYVNIMNNVKEKLKMLILEKGINLKEYLSKGSLDIKKESFEQEYFDFLYFISNENYQLLKSDFGFNPEELSIHEQFYFLNFIKNKNLDEVNKVQLFTKEFKIDGFRTFLSIEQGGQEMGDKIIDLGEKLPEDVAKKVFAKYGEIVDAADNVEQEIKSIYKNDEIPTSIFNSIKETLLKEGVNLLLNSAEIVNNGKDLNEKSILEELEKVKTDTIILGKSYIELYREGVKVPIEDITNIEKISTQDLTIEDKKELLKVYENGRPKETYENKEHIELLKKEFEETLNKKDTFVFNIRFNGRIIAFATLDQESIDTLHIGGLTFIDDVRNPAVGVAVMNAVMKEFDNFNIKALVHSENKILPMYQNRFGFKIVGELPREENAGELYYEIERPKSTKEEKNIGKREEFEKAA